MILEDLFAFPIVMVDGDNEDKKQSLGLNEDEGVDIIVGEAECPYYDFVSVADRWLPSDDSLDKAIGGKFDACYVVFNNSGNYLCPWSKTKFKNKLKSFIETRPVQKNFTMSKEEFKALFVSNDLPEGIEGHSEAE